MNKYRILRTFMNSHLERDYEQYQIFRKNLASGKEPSICVQFECEEQHLGAYVRGILWAEEIDFVDITNGRIAILVQKLSEKGIFETVGGGDYDCAALHFSFRR